MMCTQKQAQGKALRKVQSRQSGPALHASKTVQTETVRLHCSAFVSFCIAYLTFAGAVPHEFQSGSLRPFQAIART